MKFVFLILVFSSPLFAAVNLAESQLSLISGHEEFCAEGFLKVVDKNKLMVGPNLSFLLSDSDEKNLVADGKCHETIHQKIQDHKISRFTLIAKCEKSLKRLESETSEVLEVSVDNVKYTHTKNGKTSTCLFARKLK